ncbi:MAG: DinB family protein [Candidatus Rokubacteria bacterium]|nr:DinB family protein [Candidatus Rokubacteria bacterium]
MASTIIQQLRAKTDAAWANLERQLQGMELHMERSDAPGEWTARQVLAHLLFEPGSNPARLLQTFAERDFPLVDIKPGQVVMTPERKTMTLRQLLDALDAQRRAVYGYLEGLPEADLERRKARIPLFKQFMGTDEISLAIFVGAMFDFHWNDHAGQLAKIRKAVGLADAK